MFYSERKRIEEIEQREAAGESLWTNNIPGPLRLKIKRLACSFDRELKDRPGAPLHVRDISALGEAQRLLIRDRGIESLSDGSHEETDMSDYIDHCVSKEFPDVLEAIYLSIRTQDALMRAESLESLFEKKANEQLESYRVSFSMVGGEVVPFESRELHIEVVEPTLRLLSKRGWEEVEEPYREACKELARGKPDNAVTDATTALQEGLRKLGCTGKNFAQLLNSAKKTILNGADEKFISAIDLLIKWSSSMRTNYGDNHKTTKTDKQRAWLIIHLVGILLLYLTDDTR